MINIVGFNIIWFGLVYFGNNFVPIALCLLLIHLVVISNINNEIWLILSVAVIGIIVDSLLQFFNVFIFSQQSHLPLWLMVLWCCFGATLCHSLNVLARAKIYQIVVGAVFAPLSYIAGNKLNVLGFSYSTLITFCLLSVIWAGL